MGLAYEEKRVGLGRAKETKESRDEWEQGYFIGRRGGSLREEEREKFKGAQSRYFEFF